VNYKGKWYYPNLLCRPMPQCGGTWGVVKIDILMSVSNSLLSQANLRRWAIYNQFRSLNENIFCTEKIFF